MLTTSAAIVPNLRAYGKLVHYSEFIFYISRSLGSALLAARFVHLKLAQTELDEDRLPDKESNLLLCSKSSLQLSLKDAVEGAEVLGSLWRLAHKPGTLEVMV